MNTLNLNVIESSYEGDGASSYSPRMLTTVVFYAYLQNVYSGRKMETLLRRDGCRVKRGEQPRPEVASINEKTTNNHLLVAFH